MLGTIRSISLSTILKLYNETALSRKPFAIGHMYIYTFLLRMTSAMTSQNIDFSSWDTLYIKLQFLLHKERTPCLY